MHVVQSVCKLLSRIKAPEILERPGGMDEDTADQLMHDHTYGITSDPLTQVRLRLYPGLCHVVA